MDRMADSVPPLLDAQSASTDPGEATTAVFYSISNCQPGLRGISLGNFLIKNVADVLSKEFPGSRCSARSPPFPASPRGSPRDSRDKYSGNPARWRNALTAVAAKLGTDVAQGRRRPGKAAPSACAR
jgi:malonyl-CoA decarboxylase